MTTGPVVLEAPVVATERLGAYFVLTLRAPEIAAACAPGQFVNLSVGGAHLLRRPFSIYLADPAEGTIAVAFDAIGEGTQWLAARAFGDLVGTVGPLGRSFPMLAERGTDLLVGGGYGAAALAFLATELRANRGTPVAILGGRTAARVFADDVMPAKCSSMEIVTDDGSSGARGLVTDLMPAMLDEHHPRAIHACGPMRMLEAVAAVAEAHAVPAFLAVEEFMACGIGVCWTCVLPVRVGGNLKHLRSCTEGPVFEGAAVAWA